jgi:hypothetical protein
MKGRLLQWPLTLVMPACDRVKGSDLLAPVKGVADANAVNL